MDILLDSHSLLWTLYRPGVLPRRITTLLQDPETQLFVSEGSIWELTDKAAKGRLDLVGNSISRLMTDIEELGSVILPIEREDILTSVRLPHHHGDPFDRVLIAQAVRRNLVLVSKDSDVQKYDLPVIWK